MATSMIRTAGDHAGWTLVDVLVSMSFIGLLATILHGFATTSLHVVQVRQVADELDETAQIALEIVARDLREVGFGLPAALDGGLRRAAPRAVQIVRDLDFDGETTSSNERVAYILHPETGQLRRQLGAAAPQPMVDNVDVEGSGFRYFDDAGDEILDDGDELESADRRRVRRIDINLRLTAPHPAPGRRERIVAFHSTSVAPRNDRG